MENVKIDVCTKIAESVKIGKGSAVWAFASIHDGAILGEYVGVGEHTYIGRNARIGDRSRISQGCHIIDHITIGNDVFIGPCVVTMNDKHPVANNPNFKLQPPVIEHEVSVGAGAVILPGVRLGRGCVVGAGAVVTKDVAPYATVVGNPARLLVKGK